MGGKKLKILLLYMNFCSILSYPHPFSPFAAKLHYVFICLFCSLQTNSKPSEVKKKIVEIITDSILHGAGNMGTCGLWRN